MSHEFYIYTDNHDFFSYLGTLLVTDHDFMENSWKHNVMAVVKSSSLY